MRFTALVLVLGVLASTLASPIVMPPGGDPAFPGLKPAHHPRDIAEHSQLAVARSVEARQDFTVPINLTAVNIILSLDGRDNFPHSFESELQGRAAPTLSTLQQDLTTAVTDPSPSTIVVVVLDIVLLTQELITDPTSVIGDLGTGSLGTGGLGEDLANFAPSEISGAFSPADPVLPAYRSLDTRQASVDDLTQALEEIAYEIINLYNAIVASDEQGALGDLFNQLINAFDKFLTVLQEHVPGLTLAFADALGTLGFPGL